MRSKPVSIVSQLDAYDIAQDVRQSRQKHVGAILIVEGKGDQTTLYRFLDTSCQLVIAGNKKSALEALEMLDNDGYEGVLCIVDSDFEPLIYESENLVVTGHHDMDVVVFSSNALDIFLNSRADKNKLKDFELSTGKEFRRHAFDAVNFLGVMRLTSKNLRLRINFSDLSFDFVDEHTLQVDEAKLFNNVKSINTKKTVDWNDYAARCEIVRRQRHEPEMLCQGHDLMNVLALALRHCIADVRNHRTGDPDPRTWRSEIELGCRLAFGRDEFEQTTVFRGVYEWEGRTKYQVVIARPSIEFAKAS